ncbi:energy transducer TonB [Bacteroidota bacterium]
MIFFAARFSVEFEGDEYVTIGFGTFGELSSSGTISDKKEEVITKESQVKKEESKKEDNKKVELPKTEHTDEDNIVAAADDKGKKEAEQSKVKPLAVEEEDSGRGREINGEGVGKFGIDIDFGGTGIRKIYSYSIPDYPKGVSKEIDVKLKFTILTDGTVGNIIPLIKADTKLEAAAINSLRQWRFEPIPANQKGIVQTAIIIFPFRLE